jgi:adenine-specific DNA methylase
VCRMHPLLQSDYLLVLVYAHGSYYPPIVITTRRRNAKMKITYA